MATTYQAESHDISTSLQTIFVSAQEEVDRILHRASIFLDSEREVKDEVFDLDNEHIARTGRSVDPVADEIVRIYPGTEVENTPEPVLAPLLESLDVMARTTALYLTHFIKTVTSKLHAWDEVLRVRLEDVHAGAITLCDANKVSCHEVVYLATVPLDELHRAPAEHHHDTIPYNLPTMYGDITTPFNPSVLLAERGTCRDEVLDLNVVSAPSGSKATYEMPYACDEVTAKAHETEIDENDVRVPTEPFTELGQVEATRTLPIHSSERFGHVVYCVLVSLFREVRY